MAYLPRILILFVIFRVTKSVDLDLDYFLNENYNGVGYKYGFPKPAFYIFIIFLKTSLDGEFGYYPPPSVKDPNFNLIGDEGLRRIEMIEKLFLNSKMKFP